MRGLSENHVNGHLLKTFAKICVRYYLRPDGCQSTTPNESAELPSIAGMSAGKNFLASIPFLYDVRGFIVCFCGHKILPIGSGT